MQEKDFRSVRKIMEKKMLRKELIINTTIATAKKTQGKLDEDEEQEEHKNAFDVVDAQRVAIEKAGDPPIKILTQIYDKLDAVKKKEKWDIKDKEQVKMMNLILLKLEELFK